jgi:hypothetical protein
MRPFYLRNEDGTLTELDRTPQQGEILLVLS